MEVQVIARKLINPFVRTPSHLQILKISFFDQIAPSVYVPSIFYYPNNNQEITKKIDHTVLIQQLEKSMSETLTLFYPLAGRYIHDNLSVVCNDQGVEFLEAKVDADLTEFLQQKPSINHKLLVNLIPFVVRESDSTSPLLAIQITRFRCGGFAIGLVISHRIADTSTLSMFINAWATTFREGEISDRVRRPSFNLMHLFPQRKDLCLKRPPPPPPEVQLPKNAVKVFVFNKEVIDKLKSQVRGFIPSSLEVVVGLIWRGLIGSAKAQHGHLRASSLGQAMNLRGRLSRALPENACGNIVMPFLSRLDAANDESKLELSEIVSLIREAKRKAISDCAKAVNSSDDVFSVVTNSFRELFEELNKGGVDTWTFTSWCRMGLYEPNFGWGKPALVSSMAAHSSVIVILNDTKSGDGIEAWMRLKEVDMLHFLQDPDIMALTNSSQD